MERAAIAFVKAFIKHRPNKQLSIAVLCGQGNNGGDGLAIARLLFGLGYKAISCYLIQFTVAQSDDNLTNQKMLKKLGLKPIKITSPGQLTDLKADFVIDAIFGTGLNRPLTADYAELIANINKKNIDTVAVDIPSGAFADGEVGSNVILNASITFTFELPKLTFLFPESALIHQDFKVLPIGLSKRFSEQVQSDYLWLQRKDIAKLFPPRKQFSHKGTFGHALVIAGSKKTMGAALLSASACVATGAGLTTVNIPLDAVATINVALPEAMVMERSTAPKPQDFNGYTAVCVGPGLGLDVVAQKLLKAVLQSKSNLVLDADALTLLSKHKTLKANLGNAVLTPHVKEFDRLFGVHTTWFGRLQTARAQAQKLNCVIVLKNRYTFVCDTDGKVYVNPTGNPAMAQGGMGDVLSGVIVSLLVQGFSLKDAAIAGVYLHGLTADKLANKMHVVSASKLVNRLPKTLKKLTR